MEQYKIYVDGKWQAPASGIWFKTQNPYTGEDWAEIPRCGTSDVELAVSAADKAFKQGDWPAMTASARGALIRRLGDKIAEHADALAETEVRDNGKLISEMRTQLKYIPQWYYYYAGLADKLEGSVIPIDKPEMFNFTQREPIGVVAALTAWNSPLFLASFKLAPLLAAGCTVVLKPSEHASASSLEFAKVVEETGFPPGVINIITGYGDEAGAALVKHPKVSKVTFTGSDSVGKQIYSSCAKDLKKVTLELGGKSPNIVFEDARIENAANGVISGIFAANGQTCIAGSRLLVQHSIHDELVESISAIMKTVQVGDPMRPETQVGPIANRPQYEKIRNCIDRAKADGAQCVLGGREYQSSDASSTDMFIEPTIFTGVHADMHIVKEEVFGPVLCVMPFDDEEDAVEKANDTIYGLAAGVWTENMGRALRMSKALKAGTIWVNTYRALSYLSPFGGFKQSGLGRENGLAGIDEFLQTKSVWISTAESVPNPFVIR